MAQSIGSTVRRRWVIIVVGVIILLAILLSAVSGFYVDLLWFREVGFSSVFWSVYWSKVVLGLVFGVVFFVLLLSNLIIVRRLTPRFRAFSPEQEVIERYRAAIEPYARWLLAGFSALVAIFVGVAAAAQWRTFLMWRNSDGISFGHPDQVFHRDPAFYVFKLPFLHYVQGWLFSSLVAVFVIVGIAHYLTGGIRTQGVGERVTAQVKAHLSVLLGLIVLVKAWGYYLGKFDLVVSTRGVVTGASYTDIHAQLPALKVLVWVAIICSLLFLVNIRFRGWALPALGIGLLALVSVVVGALVPAAVQKFQVAPQELQKETTYIARNIEATRRAFGIDLNPASVTPTVDVTSGQVEANDLTISNIRLWNPDILKSTFQATQRFFPYYEFQDVDVDRYQISGDERVIMLSAREVSQAGIPGGGGWQSSHLIYTHGYGATASLVNTTDSSGGPAFVLSDIPPTGVDLGLQDTPPHDQGSQVYFGEVSDVPYVLVHTKQPELNFPNPGGTGSNDVTYSGRGGIPISGFLRRLLFAYRYRDINLLISGLITNDSKILINRDIQSRIRKAAPFLLYDKDPYAAVVDGRIVFIQDAYTSTSLFPYSQRVDLGQATNGDLGGQINYMRNSVKAVVDAFDGTVRFYVTDPTDPIIRVWERIFPKLFTPVSQASQALVAHFRYPEDYLQTQATQFARYHVTDPQTFFSGGKVWEVPPALPNTATGASIGTLRPYYVVLKLPGQENEKFVLFQPFVPRNRPNMVAYMAAGSDPGQYGKLFSFQFPTGVNVDGPQQIRSLVLQDPTVSPQISLLGQKGSEVLFGDMIIVPIEDSFLYVQPIFVVSANPQGVPIPELKRVVVVHGGNVTISSTLTDALATSFGQTPPPPPSGGGQPPPPTSTVAQLIQQALKAFQDAQTALKNGDLATYQSKINEAQQLIQQAQRLEAGGATPSPSPTPSGTASP